MTDQTHSSIVTGAAIARRLSNDGFAVAVLDLEETACKAVVVQIKTSGGRRWPSASTWRTNKRWRPPWPGWPRTGGSALGNRGQDNYAAAKAGLQGFTKPWRSNSASSGSR